MIIDAHTHIGKAFWGDFSPEMLLDIVDKNADFLICSNLAGIDWYTQKNELEANLKMLEASKKYSKIKPLLVCQVERTSGCEVIENLIKENLEFIGLKFHPEFTKLSANSDKYDKYLELARKYNKPCLFHSDNINSKYASVFTKDELSANNFIPIYSAEHIIMRVSTLAMLRLYFTMVNGYDI